MDVELARWLVSADAVSALAVASAEADPGSLAAAQRLRREWPAEQAAAALSQVELRRRATLKFGASAQRLFFTRDGLEQATRAEVAAWRASRFVAAGVSKVVDLGCGLGADALAFAAAGLKVIAVEADPATAVLAAANLDGMGEVICGDAVALAPGLLADGAAVFIDPARRTASGRTWRVADFSPPWDFATSLLTGRFGCIKAAPGLPSTLIPDGVAATWVSHRGDLVETSLWSPTNRSQSLTEIPAFAWMTVAAQGRRAVLLPSGAELDAGVRSVPPSGPVARYLYEPDPAVIRAGAIGVLAETLHAHLASPGIAYLFADQLTDTPFAIAFEVLDEMANDERTLRAWVRDHQIGILEIKVRGLDVDPALLRKRLKPKGSGSATLILSPTADGARALVARRSDLRPTECGLSAPDPR